MGVFLPTFLFYSCRVWLHTLIVPMLGAYYCVVTVMKFSILLSFHFISEV